MQRFLFTVVTHSRARVARKLTVDFKIWDLILRIHNRELQSAKVLELLIFVAIHRILREVYETSFI